MAPEQWREASGTGATDVWALGVILYELLSDGIHPFCDGNEVTAFARVMSRPLLPPPRLEEVSGPLARIVNRCLRPAPDERLTAAEAMTQLRALTLDSLPSMESMESVPAIEPAPAVAAKAKAFGAALALLLGAALAVVVLRPADGAVATSFSETLSVDAPAATPAAVPASSTARVAAPPAATATATVTTPSRPAASANTPRPRSMGARVRKDAPTSPAGPASPRPAPPPPKSLLREW